MRSLKGVVFASISGGYENMKFGGDEQFKAGQYRAFYTRLTLINPKYAVHELET